MANWSNPTLTSTYTNFLSELKARDEDLAKQFDGQTVSNLPTGAIRWSSSGNKWEKWSGTAWGDLSATYALTAVTASSVAVAGNITLTGAAAGDRSISTTSSAALVLGTNNSERLRILSGGSLIKGHTSEAIETWSTITYGATQATGFQNHGTQPGTASLGCALWSTSSTGKAGINIARSRSGTIGTYGLLSAGDVVGSVDYLGDDGTGFKAAGALIALVDGTAATGSMPGRLAVYTTDSGGTVPSEKWRITNDGVIARRQAAPVARNATTTLTAADIKSGLVSSTAAAAVTLTLPTGTDTEAGFNSVYTNMAFEWTVINTSASNAVTIAAATGHTISGSATVAAGNSARFVSRRSTTNTFVTYRLA